MKPEEALEIIQERIDLIAAEYKDDVPEYYEALRTAADSLARDIPRKPTKRRSEYYCSNCHVEGEYVACVGKNHHDGHKTRHEFCFKCGQLQDWSAEP